MGEFIRLTVLRDGNTPFNLYTGQIRETTPKTRVFDVSLMSELATNAYGSTYFNYNENGYRKESEQVYVSETSTAVFTLISAY